MATSVVPLNNVQGAPGVSQAQLPTNTVAPVSGTQNTLAPVNTVQNNPYAAPTATAPGVTGGAGAVPVGTVVDGGQVVSSPATGSTPTNSSTVSPTGVQSNNINWNDGSNTVTGDLKDTYGAGTGTAVSDVLSNMGTVNDSAIQATISNTDLAAGKEMGNIQAQEAAGGVTPNSSTAALAESNFYTGVNSQLQQTIGQQEVGEEDTLLSTLTNEGQQHGPDESTFDSVLGGITDAGEIGGSIASLAGFL